MLGCYTNGRSNLANASPPAPMLGHVASVAGARTVQAIPCHAIFTCPLWDRRGQCPHHRIRLRQPPQHTEPALFYDNTHISYRVTQDACSGITEPQKRPWDRRTRSRLQVKITRSGVQMAPVGQVRNTNLVQHTCSGQLVS